MSGVDWEDDEVCEESETVDDLTQKEIHRLTVRWEFAYQTEFSELSLGISTMCPN